MSEREASTSIDADSNNAPQLSPEKSLFGNSADMLRQSDIESMLHGENKTVEDKESTTKKQSDIEPESAEQPNANEDVVHETQQLVDVLPETDDEADYDSHKKQPAGDASSCAEKDATAKGSIDESIVDDAGEDCCIKRHVEPMCDEDGNANATVDERKPPVKNESEENLAEEVTNTVRKWSKKKVAERLVDEVTKKGDNAVAEEHEEPIVTPHRRAPRSAQTKQKIKDKRGTKKKRTQSESDFEEPPVAHEPEPEPQPLELNPCRRSTRVSKPVVLISPVTIPAKGHNRQSKAKKKEKSTEPKPKAEAMPTPKKTRGRKKKISTPLKSESDEEAECDEAEFETTKIDVTSKKTRDHQKKESTPDTNETEEEGEPVEAEQKVVVSPKKTRGRQKREPASVASAAENGKTQDKDELMEVDEDSQESSVFTRRSRRSTRAVTTATSTLKTLSAKCGQRSNQESSADVESQTETELTATTPHRRMTYKKTLRRGAQIVKQETDEFDLSANTSRLSSIKTPRRGAIKRPPTDTPTSSKVKRARHRRMESVDPNDPYNFDTKQNEHPVLFQNVGIVRSNFMNINFFQSKKEGDTSGKYAALEKNASERRSLLPSLLMNSKPTVTKTSRFTAKKTSGRKRAVITESVNGDDTNEGETPVKKTTRARNTPAPTPKIEKKVPPVLTPEEQQRVDASQHFETGARVFAYWNKQYYSAILSERDGLSRWNVIYTEDNSDNYVPYDSLMPLKLVTVGSHVSVLGDADEEGYQEVYVGQVKAVPSIENADEWNEGVYSIEVSNEDIDEEIRSIKWNNIFFNTKDFKVLRKNAKNATSIDTDNVIETKRIRRSCVTTPAPSLPSTPASKRGKSTKKTPARKTSVRGQSGETIQEEHETSVLSEASNGHQPIFADKTFILTAATRGDTEPPFHKKSLKRQIENRGGRVIDALTDVTDPTSTFIIADTFYRTSKYLGALSMSIPPVSFKWILESINSDQLKNHQDYLLPAGILEGFDQVVPFRPSSNILGGLRVAVYNWCPRDNINFREVWAPIITNLGGVYVELPDSIEDVIDALKNAEEAIDYMVVEEGCDYAVVDAAYEVDATPVRADWLTHAILSGELDNTDQYFMPREGREDEAEDGEEEAKGDEAESDEAEGDEAEAEADEAEAEADEAEADEAEADEAEADEAEADEAEAEADEAEAEADEAEADEAEADEAEADEFEGDETDGDEAESDE